MDSDCGDIEKITTKVAECKKKAVVEVEAAQMRYTRNLVDIMIKIFSREAHLLRVYEHTGRF